jgi:decaprenylphospho-beta-D-erythro-pentofuranosid-2-ulose 2-reductase
MNTLTTLIIGCSSTLSYELAKVHCKLRQKVIMTSHKTELNENTINDLQVRYSSAVSLYSLNLSDNSSIADFAKKLNSEQITISRLYLVSGYAASNYEYPLSVKELQRTIEINFSGPAILVAYLQKYNIFAEDAHLTFISSVAADIGRRTNYPYGAAKSGLNTFVEGLHAQISDKGLSATLVKLGYMHSATSYGKSALILTTDAMKCAKIIKHASDNRKLKIYCPNYWGIIMFVLRMIPQKIFMRLPIP